MNKKFSLLAILIVAAMILSACAPAATPPPATEPASAEPAKEVKITFMHQQVEQERQEVVASIIADFEAQNPGIKVEQIPVNEDDYDTKVATLAGSGQLPAIVEYSADQAKSSAKNGLTNFEAVDRVIAAKGESNFYSGALSIAKTEDGTHYIGVPISGWVQGIWVNTAMLKEKACLFRKPGMRSWRLLKLSMILRIRNMESPSLLLNPRSPNRSFLNSLCQMGPMSSIKMARSLLTPQR